MIKNRIIVLVLAALTLTACGVRQKPAGITDGSALLNPPTAMPVGASKAVPKKAMASVAAKVPTKKVVPTAILLKQKTFYFEFNSQKVEHRYLPALQAHAAYLKAHPSIQIKLLGHADPKGNAAYNQRLAKRRALAIATQLQADGVPSSRMTVLSGGILEKTGRRVDLIYVRKQHAAVPKKTA